jgi:hypothetical protein
LKVSITLKFHTIKKAAYSIINRIDLFDVQWRGKWQTGIRCPRGDCPSLTLSAKPTHDRKTYIAVFFPRSKAYSWVDTLLVRPINDSPMPLVNGTHNKWRKMVSDMNIPRSHAMQKLALAMLNLTESLHSQVFFLFPSLYLWQSIQYS